MSLVVIARVIAALSFPAPDAPCVVRSVDSAHVLTCADGRRFEAGYYILAGKSAIVLGYDR